MKKLIQNKPILVMVVMLLFSIFFASVGSGYIIKSIFKMTTGFIVLGVLYTIVGKDLFSWSKKSTRFAFLCGCVPIIINTYDTILRVMETYQNPFRRLHDDWWISALIILVYCLSIGFWEEGLFRGIITNGLVKLLPKTKCGIYIAIALSSLIFGLSHIIGYDLQTDILNNVVRVLRTGSIGIVMAAVYLRTKNIWPCMLVHAMIDFATYVETALTAGAVASSYIEKVFGGGFWSADTKMAVFQIVANVIITIIVARKIEPTECVMWKSNEEVKEEVSGAVS